MCGDSALLSQDAFLSQHGSYEMVRSEYFEGEGVQPPGLFQLGAVGRREYPPMRVCCNLESPRKITI